MKDKELIRKCKLLIDVYKNGKLGRSDMPEDSSPSFSDSDIESRLVYFTLPMSLNYQRDSYKLWSAALLTFNDKNTNNVFDVNKSAKMKVDDLREALMKYKLALQKNRHIEIWQKISRTISTEWGSISNLIEESSKDFLILKDWIQGKYKKGFPYLSGPKIFNYWSFIIQQYGKIKLKNSEYIEIAPDTHVLQCSVKLGVINECDVKNVDRNQISKIWRDNLKGSNINPIDMHSPLWFWSKNSFKYNFEDEL